MAADSVTPPAPDPSTLAKQIFGARADFYTTSAAHTDPQVLARVVELSQPATNFRALDIATGTGHTAFALAAKGGSVIGIDLTPEMLERARRRVDELKLTNVHFQIGDALALPFADGSFDIVTCRRAAHHFSDIKKSLSEMHRVLRANGRLVIDDRSVPEDDFTDRTMNLLDKWHDESHVRQYRPSEWTRLLDEAGFELEVIEPYTRHRPLSSLTQGVSAENTAKIHAFVQTLSSEERRKMNVSEVGGVTHINHWHVMLAAVTR